MHQFILHISQTPSPTFPLSGGERLFFWSHDFTPSPERGGWGGVSFGCDSAALCFLWLTLAVPSGRFILEEEAGTIR